MPDRKWLQYNQIDFTEFPEEKKYQELLTHHDFENRAKQVLITQSYNNAAEKVAEFKRKKN